MTCLAEVCGLEVTIVKCFLELSYIIADDCNCTLLLREEIWKVAGIHFKTFKANLYTQVDPFQPIKAGNAKAQGSMHH